MTLQADYTLPPATPALLRAFVAAALQVEPSKRPSASELLEHAWLEGEEATPPVDTLPSLFGEEAEWAALIRAHEERDKDESEGQAQAETATDSDDEETPSSGSFGEEEDGGDESVGGKNGEDEEETPSTPAKGNEEPKDQKPSEKRSRTRACCTVQ